MDRISRLYVRNPSAVNHPPTRTHARTADLLVRINRLGLAWMARLLAELGPITELLPPRHDTPAVSRQRAHTFISSPASGFFFLFLSFPTAFYLRHNHGLNQQRTQAKDADLQGTSLSSQITAITDIIIFYYCYNYIPSQDLRSGQPGSTGVPLALSICRSLAGRPLTHGSAFESMSPRQGERHS